MTQTAAFDLREDTMRVLGAKLPTYMIGRKTTRWTYGDLDPAERDRLLWAWKIIMVLKRDPHPWDDVTLRTWFMGMNPRLAGDDHNNPAMFVREGRGEEVLRAANGDYYDGSMGA